MCVCMCVCIYMNIYVFNIYIYIYIYSKCVIDYSLKNCIHFKCFYYKIAFESVFQ